MKNKHQDKQKIKLGILVIILRDFKDLEILINLLRKKEYRMFI